MWRAGATCSKVSSKPGQRHDDRRLACVKRNPRRREPMPAFGITTFPTDYAMSPIELAEAVEERGFDSLFFNEHTHIPVSRRSPFPGGGELPEQYRRTY